MLYSRRHSLLGTITLDASTKEMVGRCQIRSQIGYLPRLPNGAELSKIITPLPPGSEALTETELVHQLGGAPSLH